MTDTRRALGSRYELVEQIGHGTSGVVWRAWDRRSQKPVAAKLLWPHFAHDEEVLTRFIRERTILMSLRHPNIVNVTDLVVEGDDLAIIMDLVQGPSLAEVLHQSGTLPVSTAVGYVAAVLDALAYAHSQGVFHRDVKTDNIMLATAEDPGPQDVRLADFGIARLTRDTAASTETIGTPYYMAPELASYGKSGPASDVYAAGVVLYELIAGRTPFAGKGTSVTISLRHLSVLPPPLDIPAGLQAVLDTMLAKDPAHRSTAADTAQALRDIPAADLPSRALPAQPEPDQWEPSPETLPAKPEVERTLGYQISDPADENVSPDATSLRARHPLRQPPPSASPEAESGPADSGGLTRVKTAPAQDPVQSPQAGSPKKRLPLILGIGAGVVVLVTALILWLAGVFDHTPSAPDRPPVTTAAAHVTGDTLPTGLRVDVDSAYDPADEATSLRVTLAATPTSGLTGDILIDIPPLVSGQACPPVTAAPPATVQPLKASTDGFTGVCAHKLEGVALGPGATSRVDLTVGLDLFAEGGQPPADYGAWLDLVTRTTDQDLRDITGAVFPLQRVTGIAVTVDSVNLTEVDGTPVPYSVEARWLGDATGGPSSTPVFTDQTIAGMETSLLRNLTGDAGLKAVSVDACDATITSGISVLARQPSTNCALQVQVGSLTAPDARFAILMR